MKKFICILLSMMMLFGALCTMLGAEEATGGENTTQTTTPGSDTNEPNTNEPGSDSSSEASSESSSSGDNNDGAPTLSGTINDNLVIFWDFEGENALEDKATFGEAQDNLTVNGDGVTVTDGVAYIPKTTGACLTANRSNDMLNVESMTIYAKLKYTGEYGGSFADAFAYDGLFRFQARGYSASKGATQFGSILLGASALVPGLYVPADSWFYVAITMEADFSNVPENVNGEADVEGVDATASLVIHYSTDGTTWTKLGMNPDLTDGKINQNSANEKSELYGLLFNLKASNRALYLGKTCGSGQPDRGLDFYFDDFRIYNKALTASEVKQIKPNTTELNAPESSGDESNSSNNSTENNTPSGNDTPSNTTAKKDDTTTKAPADKTTTTTEAPATQEKSGCGAVAAMSLVFVTTCIGGAVLAVKKKNDEA